MPLPSYVSVFRRLQIVNDRRDVMNIIKEKPHYTNGIETIAAFQIGFPKVAFVRGKKNLKYKFKLLIKKLFKN